MAEHSQDRSQHSGLYYNGMNWYSLNWVGHQVGSFFSSDKSEIEKMI